MFRGFPCTKFSQSGKQEGFGDQPIGRLVFYLVRIAKHRKPPCLLLENVRALSSVTYKGISCLRLICLAFQKIGYHEVVHQINALKAGVAQSRDRMYLAVFREERSKDRYVESLNNLKSPLRMALRKYQLGVKDILQKCSDKPDRHKNPDLFIRPDKIKEDKKTSWRKAARHVLCLDSEKPARCVTAHYAKSSWDVTYICPKTKKLLGLPSKHEGVLKYDQYKEIGVRLFTDEELHKLMGFSKIMKWTSTNKGARPKLLGNAVVPKVVAPIMAQMFEALGFPPYFPHDTLESGIDLTVPQVEHAIVNMHGVDVHTFQ